MLKTRYVLTTAIVAILLTFAAAMSNMAHAAGRFALVIGNSNYSFAPLRNPAQDASLMAATLRVLGFDVSEYQDVAQRDLKRAVVDFGRKLEQAGKDAVGLVYYAGHGVQVNGENYLIPIGANIRDELDVDIEGVRASVILSALERAGNGLNIVVLDACRNNPFQSGTRAVRGGLARMDAPSGTLLAYSTSPGNVAEDGTGRNSPYTQALAQSMRTKGAKVEDVFKRVRVAVMERTNNRQVPWEASSLTGDFYFVDDGAGGQVAIPTPESQGRSATDQAVEIEYWKSISDTDNPDMFKSYLSAFPNGLFASIAEKRIAALGGGGQQSPNPQQTLGGQTPGPLWESIKTSEDPTVFQAFLAEFPTGFYARLARARLDSLGAPLSTVTALAPAQTPVSRQSLDPSQLEVDLRFWEAIGNSNRRGDYLAYLQKFPNGQFAALAYARLADLDKDKVALAGQAVSPPVPAPAPTPAPVVQPAPQQVAVAPAVTSSSSAGAGAARAISWSGKTRQLDSGGEPSLLCNTETAHDIKMQVQGASLTGTITAPELGSVSIRATVQPNGRFHGKMFYLSAWSISGYVMADKITGKFWNPLTIGMCRGAFELTPG